MSGFNALQTGLSLFGLGMGGGVPAVPPVADFEANVLFGTVPFTVEFTDLSINDPTSWSWNFGDGSELSTEQNSTHQYTTPGVYTVSLTVTNAGGEDTETKTGYISAYREVTLTLQPDGAAGEDTTIYSAAATLNFGTTTTFIAGIATIAGRVRRALVRSDVSSIPAGSIIDSGILTLYCEIENSTTDYNVGAHRALTQWYEGAKNGAVPDAGQDGSTWNLRNANGSVVWAGGAGGAAGSDWVATATDTKTITGVGSFAWDVAADVAAWVAGTATNYGWWLVNTDEVTIDTNKVFTSSDGIIANNRPKLTVVYRTTTPA